jgi:hypothetical protein
MKPWMRRLKGVNRVAITRVEATTARVDFSLEPSYPGVTAGGESASGTVRLLLACTAYTREEKALGVDFTALISGRRCQVSVAPVEAHVPRGWQELDDLACDPRCRACHVWSAFAQAASTHVMKTRRLQESGDITVAL